MAGQNWIEVNKERLRCFSYRRTQYGAYTKTLIYGRNGKIFPIEERRSKSGRHGEDCYSEDQLDRAVVIIRVDISNSGKDRTAVKTVPDNGIPVEVLKEIVRDLREIGVSEEIILPFEKALEKQAKQ